MILATPRIARGPLPTAGGAGGVRRGLEARVADGQSAVGGGTTPGLELPSPVVALRHRRQGPDWLDAWLRSRDMPVVGRIERDWLLLDLRTVLESEDADLAHSWRPFPADAVRATLRSLRRSSRRTARVPLDGSDLACARPPGTGLQAPRR